MPKSLTGESSDGGGKEAALEGELGDAADTGGGEGDPAAEAGGGNIATAACGREEMVALNGCKTAPFGKEFEPHFREVGSFNLARFKLGAGARLGSTEVATDAVVDILPAKCSGSTLASSTILLAAVDDLGGKKIEYTFFGSRETEETSSYAGKDGSSVKTESTGTLAAADTRAST